jgi:DNA-binding protein HU-beta
MTKTDLIHAIADETGLETKDVRMALNAVLAAISAGLKNGGIVQLRGFGTFMVREHAERLGRNPQNGDLMIIPATKAPAFKAGRLLKKAVLQ